MRAVQGSAAEGLSVRYHRGFPDEVGVFVHGEAAARLPPLLAATGASELTVASPGQADTHQFLGPHLAAVRRLTFRHAAGLLRFPDWAACPHLTAVEDLALPAGADWPDAAVAAQAAAVAAAPFARRLRRLSLPVRTAGTAAGLAAAGLVSLTDLTLDLSGGRGEPMPGDAGRGRRLDRLSGAADLAGVTGLDLTAPHFDEALVAAAVDAPAWRGLRRLALRGRLDTDGAGPLGRAAGTPHLDELTVTPTGDNGTAIDALARSPLVGRLRRLSLAGVAPSRAAARLVDALDPTRVESVTLPRASIPAGDRERLRRRFGDRVWLVPHERPRADGG